MGGGDPHLWDSLFEFFSAEYGFSPEQTGELTLPQINRYVSASYHRNTGKWEFDDGPKAGSGVEIGDAQKSSPIEVKEEKKGPEVKLPDTLRAVQEAFSPRSVVREPTTGMVSEYHDAAIHMSPRVIRDASAFKEIEERFKNVKDKSGQSMSEVCRAYWEAKRRGR